MYLKLNAGKHLGFEMSAGKKDYFTMDGALIYWVLPTISLFGVGRFLIASWHCRPRPNEMWRDRYWFERCDADDHRAWVMRLGGYEVAWHRPPQARAALKGA